MTKKKSKTQVNEKQIAAERASRFVWEEGDVQIIGQMDEDEFQKVLEASGLTNSTPVDAGNCQDEETV